MKLLQPVPEDYIYSDGGWWIVQKFKHGGVGVRGSYFTSMEACRNHFEGGDMAELLNLAAEVAPAPPKE